MGNQHSASHATLKPRKNVHWKSAGRPAVPGKPEIIPIASEDEPNAVTLRWAAASHDGGAALRGYQVECNRLGAADWLQTAPPLVVRPELVLTGLDPPHRYQFRVAAVNAVGRSDYSELSDVLTVASERALHEPPRFLRHLEDTVALENDKTEFRVSFAGVPAPAIAWFKDDYEIFSSRRTAIATDDTTSVLAFHQTLASDEGEIKCTATNRAGHAVSRARLALEAAPKLRYPRQYEDGLLYEINETVFLKMTIVGKPTPTVDWRHNGQPVVCCERIEVSNTPKFSMLKIQSARRSDRGEYQVAARNSIGEDTAAFLVTVTAPPDPPRRVSVARQVDKSVTLAWDPPEDDGGCRIGNYIVEYYRTGWNVWLKATTSRKTNVTLFDMIEGSEYRFRVKAESPYGMSAPSEESAPVRIPGRAVDMEFLAVESRIINQELEDEPEQSRVSPAPRRKRPGQPPPAAPPTPPSEYKRPRASSTPPPGRADPNEFILILYPDNKTAEKAEISEKRSSFQLDLEEALSPPPLSLSAPELSAWCAYAAAAGGMRHAVSSSELLHERAMARFYNAVALQERLQQAPAHVHATSPCADYIPQSQPTRQPTPPRTETFKRPDIFIKTDSIEDRQYKYDSRQASQDSEASYSKWQHTSFEEDYTASTVSTENEFSDEGSLDGETERNQYSNEQDTYNPRDKVTQPSTSLNEVIEEEDESEREILKPLPLPDPNFVPKPILKRRESNDSSDKPTIDNVKTNSDDKQKSEEKPVREEPPKKQEKMNIFKKFTKMPVQKPFPFPKILKKQNEKPEPEAKPMLNNKPDTALTSATKKVEKIDETISDEGRTVIDYYGSIVKEYGSQKRPTTPLYLNTKDLKTIAEKQALEKKQNLAVEQKKVVRSKKTVANKTNKGTKVALNNAKVPNSVETKPKTKDQAPIKTKLEKKTKLNSNKAVQDIEERPPKKGTQQIVVTTSERATVVTINYKELEERAKAKVRSAIDYAVDSCLLLLAFWLYLFRDERLAVPLLALVGYRQLRAALLAARLPRWAITHAPAWLKRKAS